MSMSNAIDTINKLFEFLFNDFHTLHKKNKKTLEVAQAPLYLCQRQNTIITNSGLRNT